MSLNIPSGYQPALGIRETEEAIKDLKDFFEKALATNLNLTRVTAPLFVAPESGLNDNLNGVERPVGFGIKEQNDREVEIVHSLAKWKRHALRHYGFSHGEGLYTDMNAIRRDEETDNIHSIFVDQWDWERIIDEDERNIYTLQSMVQKIYQSLQEAEDYMATKYDYIRKTLPLSITFLTTQQLEDKYPAKTPREREYLAVKEYGAIFLMQIGDKLKSGEPHDGRAPDYDDWSMNGDIIVYYDVLDIALELSSMGIRVNEESLRSQLKKAGCVEREKLPFQKAILNRELPFTIGGGLGQSRICMFFLKKAHIGEVQASIWPEEVVKEAKNHNIQIL